MVSMPLTAWCTASLSLLYRFMDLTSPPDTLQQGPFLAFSDTLYEVEAMSSDLW